MKVKESTKKITGFVDKYSEINDKISKNILEKAQIIAEAKEVLKTNFGKFLKDEKVKLKLSQAKKFIAYIKP